jgi:glyoxylase-like metal-dependent hydrolase (beta-lactamase superfamily II)
MTSRARIVRIPILPFHMVNAHLIIGQQGAVLVDTGLPGYERRFEKALRKEGLSFADITLIVVTHAHFDHAGGAARLRALTGAPILAHEDDAEHYNQQTPMTFCTTDWFSRLFLRTNMIRRPYTAFIPDILLSQDEVKDLAPYGIAGRVRSTPGHTKGSLSLELDSGEAFVGDLVASGVLLGGIARMDHAKRPPFEDDPQRVGMELRRLVEAGIETFYLGHGGPLPAKEVSRHAQWLGTIRNLSVEEMK